MFVPDSEICWVVFWVEIHKVSCHPAYLLLAITVEFKACLIMTTVLYTDKKLIVRLDKLDSSPDDDDHPWLAVAS